MFKHLNTFIILFSFLLVTFASSHAAQVLKYGVHVKSILVMYNNVYVSFHEEIANAPRAWGRWQTRIIDISNPQTKALLAILINARNNQEAIDIWYNEIFITPTSVNHLAVIDGISHPY